MSRIQLKYNPSQNMTDYSKDIISFTQKLISIPSVNGVNNEVEIINEIAKEAKKLDLPFKIMAKDKNHPNIFVGENFDKKTGLLLIAHVDTAGIGDETRWTHKPFGGEIENNRIYGRGSIDCKAGVALSLYTLKILKDQGKLSLAKFVGVSDEERGADSLFGAKHLLDKGLDAKSAIYTYSGNDVITIGHRGQVKLWVTVTGESNHSGSKSWQDGTKGASAIDALNRFLTKLNKFNLKGKHKAFPGYSFKQTVLFIEGGTITSLVPDKARALIDARLLPNHSNNNYIEEVKKIAQQFETDKIKFNVSVQTYLPAAFISKGERVVQILDKFSQKVLGTKSEIRGCGPANEGYLFINKGIPTICGFGVGGDGVHSANESVEIESLFKTLEIYTKAALEL